MKCSKCGTELMEDAKFCVYCGEKIKAQTIAHVENAINEPIVKEAATSNSSSEKKSGVDKIKKKVSDYWQKIDLFSKIDTVAIVVVAILMIIALCVGKIIPIIFSIIQFVGLVAALLMHKGRIKCNKKWLEYLVLIVAILISVLNIISYSWFGSSNEDGLSSDSISRVDTPYSALECIGKNNEVVKHDFQLSGFSNISEEVIEDLDIDEADKCGIVECVSINGLTNFERNTEFKSTAKVTIKYHSFKRINVPVSSDETKFMDAELVVKAFKGAGFVDITIEEVYDLDPDMTDAEFENDISINGINAFDKDAEFSLNADIKISIHRPYDKYTVKVIVDFIPNLIFSRYDVKFELDGHTEILGHGKDTELEYRVAAGKYILTFSSAESSTVKGSVELDVSGDTEASYKINCYSDKINVETLYIEDKGDIGENEAMVPVSALNCKHENYENIEKAFKDAGFTNISMNILYDIVWGLTDEGEVEQVSVNEKTDFRRGDIFLKEVPIVITYHRRAEDDPNKSDDTKVETTVPEKPRSVFYSTNDYETAKKGNTGVFSYKNKRGSYDVYWIINFDEGYVYWFTEGNNESSCDKVKMVSGDLNDRVTVTWHEGENQWSWYLHFKYVNHPETLVVNDHNGVATEFTTTDLDDALGIRDTKKIKEY